VSSLIAALEDVKGWDRLAREIDVPQSKREEIRRRYSDDAERTREVLKEWQNHHPAPNWMLVANALYRMRAGSTHEVLHQLRQKYLEGKKTIFSVSTYMCMSQNGEQVIHKTLWDIQTNTITSFCCPHHDFIMMS